MCNSSTAEAIVLGVWPSLVLNLEDSKVIAGLTLLPVVSRAWPSSFNRNGEWLFVSVLSVSPTSSRSFRIGAYAFSRILVEVSALIFVSNSVMPTRCNFLH